MDKKITPESRPTAAMTSTLIDCDVRDILLLHFKCGMSAESIATIFSLRPEDVEEKISTFTQQFSNESYLMNVINGLASMKKDNRQSGRKTPEETDKDRELADLKRRLTQAEIRAEAYEEMIRLAEVRYGIPIRKKSGAK